MAHTPGKSTETGAAAGDLFGDDEPLFPVPVAHVAETLQTSAGRGRPKGSANKRTLQMRETLLKMGFRHPMMNLAALANAEPGKLAQELACDKLEAAEMIRKANVDLLPYFESKRPVEVHVEERSLGVLVVGDMAQAQVVDGVFSLTGVIGDIEENQ